MAVPPRSPHLAIKGDVMRVIARARIPTSVRTDGPWGHAILDRVVESSDMRAPQTLCRFDGTRAGVRRSSPWSSAGRHRYGVLLGFMTASIVFTMAAPAALWGETVAVVLQVAVLLAAMRTAAASPQAIRLGVAAGVAVRSVEGSLLAPCRLKAGLWLSRVPCWLAWPPRRSRDGYWRGEPWRAACNGLRFADVGAERMRMMAPLESSKR